jgi:WD40 repeat protein
LITGSADSTARVIDLETGTALKAFPDHTGPVVDLRLMSKDELLVTGKLKYCSFNGFFRF